jgi:hypothetical protein
MQDQRSASQDVVSTGEDPAGTVLYILLSEHPSLLHVDELVRLYARGSVELERARVLVEDALSELLGSGLVHRLDRFVFASRAALRGQALAL